MGSLLSSFSFSSTFTFSLTQFFSTTRLIDFRVNFINKKKKKFFLHLYRDDKDMGVVLKFLDGDRRVRETVYGREYLIKAEVQQPNTTYGIKVKNCFAFNKKNTSISLIDERGCPFDRDIITSFASSPDGRSAVAMLKSMFKFPEGSEVHFQCDIEQCSGKCVDVDEAACNGRGGLERYIDDTKGRAQGQQLNGMQLASSTVFVIDPALAPCKIFEFFKFFACFLIKRPNWRKMMPSIFIILCMKSFIKQKIKFSLKSRLIKSF